MSLESCTTPLLAKASVASHMQLLNTEYELQEAEETPLYS